MNKTYPYPYDPEDKIHSISIKNFTKKIDGEEYPSDLLELCRCVCCLCLLFTDLPERFCKWWLKE